MNAHRTDAELLEALRAGDTAAFAVLWRRHSDAGRRYARQALPGQVDDLVAESFLAIYQQVTTTEKGPTFAFRPYLRAVIRNTAMRWGRDSRHLSDGEDIDQVEPRDGLAHAEEASESADVLAAFRDLPERWQRVLWLTEVDEVPRPEIARELGIKPNAVSALHRRAREGLRLHWLNRQVPEPLRGDGSHVARLLPRHLTEPKNVELAASVTAHVATCIVCDDLLRGMRVTSNRVQARTLATLLGAGGLGATATAAGLSTGTTAVAAGLFGIGLGGYLTTGALTIAAIGGSVLLTTVISVTPAEPRTGGTTNPAAAAPVDPAAAPPGEPRVTAPSTPPDPQRPIAAEPSTGRKVDDPSVPSITLVTSPDGPAPLAPTRPKPADPATPSPGDGTTLSPGVTSPPATSGYLAPVLTGTTQPGTNVAVEIDGQRFTPAVAGDGTWTFDARGLQLAAGTHDYTVWAFDDQTRSTPTTGSITILPIVVTGFEGLSGFEDMTVPEAQTTGLVIEMTGPPDGRIFLSTMEGHTAIVPLDGTGHTRLRLLMNSRGWYYFTFRALDADDVWGPGVEAGVDVYDPDIVFDPWGPSPDDMTFDLTAP